MGEDALDLGLMVWIIRGEQQVDVDCLCLRCLQPKAQLYVREDGADVGETPVQPQATSLPIRTYAEVVGYPDHFECGRRGIDRVDETIPGLRKPVREEGPRSVKMRVPSAPLRTAPTSLSSGVHAGIQARCALPYKGLPSRSVPALTRTLVDHM